jgi:diguanylate cyclase (GGDEF)-like protein/PAS domain S-box-containing protein
MDHRLMLITMPDDNNRIEFCLNQCSDATLFIDKSGFIVLQNSAAERLFGYSNDEVVGRQISDILQGQTISGTNCNAELRELLGSSMGGALQDFELFVAGKDGTVVHLNCSFMPLTSESIVLGLVVRIVQTESLGKTKGIQQKATFLQIASELGSIGLFDYNAVSGELVWNDILRAQFGISKEAEVNFDTYLNGVHPSDRRKVVDNYHESFDPKRSGGRNEFEFRIINAIDGNERWLSASGRIFYHEGKPVRHIGASIDITQRKKLEEKLRQAALHDPLTGLANRTLLAESGASIIESARANGTRCAIFFIDVDRFKLVNDVYGHDIGDQILMQVAFRLNHCLDTSTIVSRLGGDEFIVLQPEVDHIADAERCARTLLKELHKPIHVGLNEVAVCASIGISLFPDHGESLESLVKCADLAMYVSRKAGVGAYAVYTSADGNRADQQLQAELNLKHAVEAGTMNVLFQPIVRIDDGVVIGAEALIRATGFHGEPLSPADFIPIAEKTGQIKPLGLWVTRAVCCQIRNWQDQGWSPVPIAINVSAYQLSEPSFADEFLGILREFGIAPSHIHVEVTESAVMNDLYGAIELLERLRLSGIHVSLDDFGTGYSSLSQLSNLPLDKLKIDQTFVLRLETDAVSQAVIDTIIGLGQRMHLQVLGEGIENQQALDYLRERGCNQGQGFFFSKPLTARDFRFWCEERGTAAR